VPKKVATEVEDAPAAPRATIRLVQFEEALPSPRQLPDFADFGESMRPRIDMDLGGVLTMVSGQNT
jgi:hypothetical protein